MDLDLPDKLYFKIGEVAELAGVKPHVLRYWESEFGTFRPTKSKTNQRLYKKKDIEFVLQLKKLLHEQGYTIAGARKRLRELARGGGAVDSPQTASQPDSDEQDDQMMLPLVSGVDSKLVDEIRSDIVRLRDSLKKDLPKISE
ncbi:MAG: MerR family transcriptional regulator [Desulfuromonas sp.]|nr:MAG: MerR family transcriptional regulator [Desulfuromonas sp.]